MKASDLISGFVNAREQTKQKKIDIQIVIFELNKQKTVTDDLFRNT